MNKLGSCIVCSSDKSKNLYDINGYNIVKCINCDFVYVDPLPEEDRLLSLYNESYFKNPAFDNLDTSHYYGYDIYIEDRENIRNKFKKCLKILLKYQGSGRLLDVGCATGFFLELAREYGFQTKGVEVSEFACRYATENLGLDIIHSDLLNANLDKESFDVVTLLDVLEHFRDPQAEMREINRIMRMGGILVIITPDIEGIISRILGRNWLEMRRVPAHLYFFSKRTLNKFLLRTGYEILETRTIGKKFYFDSMVRNILFQKRFLGLNPKGYLKYLPLKTFSLPVNPLYKILAFARKVNDSERPK